jgi:hypothetical protein
MPDFTRHWSAVLKAQVRLALGVPRQHHELQARGDVQAAALAGRWTGRRAAHSDLGLTWYSKTKPPTVPRMSAMPTATNHHWSKARANPSTLADAAIPIGQ